VENSKVDTAAGAVDGAASPPRELGGIGVLQRIARAHPATILMAGAVLLSGGLLLHWLSRLTFWRDEWAPLLHRRSWSVGSFLDPIVEHLVAIPVLSYKVLVTTFGMDSPAPFQFVATVAFLISVILLFIYARGRLGEWIALAAVLPILFLGPSWDDLLFPYQLGYFGSVACGLGSLLALDRRDKTGDVTATILLIASLMFSDVGIPFVAGAVVEVLLGRDRWGRAYVFAIPTVLWGLWYLGWGHTAPTFISFHNFANLPGYVTDGLASSIGSLLGLGTPQSSLQVTSLDWGRPLLVLAVAVAALRLYRLGKVPDRVLTVLAVGVGFWCLTGLNASVLGAPTVGRYQYVGVVGIVLIASELARGMKIPRVAVWLVLFVAAAAALSNVSLLRDTAKGLAGIADQERGGLAALELTRGEVDPGFVLTEQNSDVDYLGLVDASSYFSAVDAYGSPAYTPAELAAAPEAAKVAADKVFGAALGVRLVSAPATKTGHCVTARPRAQPVVTPVPRGGLVLRSRRLGTQLALRRYATASFPVALGPLRPGRASQLEIPTDQPPQPWQLELSGGGAVSVCDRPSA
jgi:hypothetical protein